MTHAAQAALRRTIEKETRSTRFCLLCNYVSRIIEPLTSRCTKFRFKPLMESMIFERLRYICTQEKVECDDATLSTLVETSGGDMRRAITCLQSCAKLKGSGVPIGVDSVLEVTGVRFWSLIVIKSLIHNGLWQYLWLSKDQVPTWSQNMPKEELCYHMIKQISDKGWLLNATLYQIWNKGNIMSSNDFHSAIFW